MTVTSRTTLANALRVLAMDAVQKSNSGHPGMPMGMADIGEALWRHQLRHNPLNPKWPNRDRFVLSNGHGSMLIYGLLHLTGYDLSLEDIKNFRQWHSKTPGHPEYGYTDGVETTTGPLGQGIANAVGMALAERMLAAQFNRDGYPIVDHHTYVFMGDGCMMEGVSHEACSLAGTWHLNKLVAFWDDNGISIDGHVEGWFTDDTPARFESYGWNVLRNVDGHDPTALDSAIAAAKSQTEKPTLICCKTVIGSGSPNKAGTHDSHGAPLGADEVAATRRSLGWTDEPFVVSKEIYDGWDARQVGKNSEGNWNNIFQRYSAAYPELATEFLRRTAGEISEAFRTGAPASIEAVAAKCQTIASRKASQNAITSLAPLLPELLGGSADLSGSNLTSWPASKSLQEDGSGNYLHYGVREFGMAAIMNGISLHGGIRPFGGTFLMFSEYARNALRMAALMKINPIYVFTHDSIGLGEDGPTHQPVEQTATLRMIPNMDVWRPCDSVETQVSWTVALESKDHPTSLILSRQNLPFNVRTSLQLGSIRKGGYVLSDCLKVPHVVLIATGSEVSLATDAQQVLAERGIPARVVSMPSTFVFEKQSQLWRDDVLPPGIPRVAIEAGVTSGWYKYVGLDGEVIGLDHFGESAPAATLFEKFGITVDAVVAAALKVANKANYSKSRLAPITLHGQQIWLDKLSRSLIQSGELQSWIDDHAVAGVTSNPAIFAQAFAEDPAYAPALQGLRATEPNLERRFELLAIADVQAACDKLRPLYKNSRGDSGYVSFEISPRLSHDAEGSLIAAKRLWAEIDRPNAMIKIPATKEGLLAISGALAEGINVNVTLMFSKSHAQQVFQACSDGLRTRLAQGSNIGRVRSVASIFVSRLDSRIDPLIPESAKELRGQLGIANARSCYALWSDTFGASAFADIRASGGHPPSCLWASTGNKNPDFKDVRYVEELIGPATVNTVPEVTLKAFAHHGQTGRTLDTQLLLASSYLDKAATLGLNLDQIGDDLQKEGLEQFDQAFDRLLRSVS